MNPRLQQLFHRLEDDRCQLAALLQKHPEEYLHRNPRPRKWSVMEILLHLVTSERLTVNYMRKKSLVIDSLKDAGLMESLKLTLLVISQRLPLRYKAPTVVLEHTPAMVPLPALLTQWDEIRTDLNVWLDSVADRHLHRLIYKHPVVGRLDVVQALTFMQAHFHHHLPQIARLL